MAIIANLDRQIMSILIGPVKADLALTDSQFSLAQGVGFAACYSLAAIPIGFMVDHYARRRLLFMGMVAWSLGCVWCGLANNFWSLLLGRMMVGVGEAVLVPAGLSLIGDAFPRGRVGTPAGLFGASGYLGTGLSMMGGGLLVGILSASGGLYLPGIGTFAPWRSTLLIVGVPGVLISVLAFAIYDPRGASKSTGITSEMSMLTFLRLRRKVLVPFLCGIGSLIGAVAVVASWTPAFLMRHYSLDIGTVGLLLGLALGVLAPAGSIMGGLIIDRLYRKGVLAASFWLGVVAAVAGIPLLAMAYLYPSVHLSIAMTCITILILGVAPSINYSGTPMIAPPEARGKMAAITILVASGLSQALAPLSVATLTDYVVRDPMKVGISLAVVGPGLCLVSAISFFLGVRPMRALIASPDTPVHKRGH